MSTTQILDKNGHPITIGARLCVRIRSSLHGGIEEIVGEVASVDTKYKAVGLILEHDRKAQFKGELRVQPAGAEYNLLLPGEQKDGVFTCLQRTHGFGQDHDVSAEVLAPKPVSAPSTPASAPSRPRPGR